MKLETTLTASRDGSLVDATDENLIHDAAAAHALIQAITQCYGPGRLWIHSKADLLMREWGFTESDDIHTCSYHCDRPGCIRAQRDALRDELAELRARIEGAPAADLLGWSVVDGKRLWAPDIFLPIDDTGMPIGSLPRRVRLLVEDGE